MWDATSNSNIEPKPESNFRLFQSQVRISFETVELICLFVSFFLHLFILQAIYIVLQDLKMKMLFVE